MLNADYLTVPEEQIRSLQSLLTIVGGRVVYAAGPFDASAGKKATAKEFDDVRRQYGAQPTRRYAY